MKHVKFEYVVYNDGYEWGRYDSLDAAEMAIAAYDGDHDLWYEIEAFEEDVL